MACAPASLHCSMSLRQASIILRALGVFSLNVHMFLSSQICQVTNATIVLTPLLSRGAAEFRIAAIASVVVLHALQEAGESAAQPIQVAAFTQTSFDVLHSQIRWKEDSRLRQHSWQK